MILNKKRFLYILTIFFLSQCFVLQTVSARQTIQDGLLVLENPEILDNSYQILEGNWAFYWNQLLVTAKNTKAEMFLPVPDDWNAAVSQLTGKKTSLGSGTYKLLVANLRPGHRYAVMLKDGLGTSGAIYANGQLVYATGSIGLDYSKNKPKIEPIYAEFLTDQEGEVELVVQVSNGFHRLGGLWSTVCFGDAPAVFRYYNSNSGFSFFIASFLIILAMINMTSYLLSRKDLYGSLSFSIFLITFALRVLTSGFSSLVVIFPQISVALLLRLEYLIMWLGPITFLFFLEKDLLHDSFSQAFRKLIIGASLAIGAVSLVLPLSILSYIVPVMQILVLVFGLFFVYTFIASLVQKKRVSLDYTVGVALLLSGAILEIVFSVFVHSWNISMLHLSLLLYSFFYCVRLAAYQAKIYKEQLALTKDIQKLNKAYLRFVPEEFLTLLKKHSITEINLGDHIEMEMTILFSQLYLKDKSREPTPADQFEAFNTYLQDIVPAVLAKKGFISKFISRGYMALFPQSADDAFESAIEMVQKINDINVERKKLGQPELATGIGIHYGQMILGTIGEENRLDDTVISDTVNTAARLESLAEQTEHSIIVTQDVLNQIDGNYAKYLHPLGESVVRGKTISLSLYELSVCPEKIASAKTQGDRQ